MEGLLITIIIVGCVFILGSFFIKEKGTVSELDREKLAVEVRDLVLSQDNMDRFLSDARDTFMKNLDDLAEDKKTNLTDSLNEDANHKMIALNEMYEGLIAKIEENHKEVIFLYDMLNQKSGEIKDASAKIEGLKKDLVEEEKKLGMTYKFLDKKLKILNSVASEKGNKDVQKPLSIVKKSEKSLKEEQLSEKSLSVNEKILRMHEEGKSIMEISKILGMGQGEVSLIIGIHSKK